MKIQPINQPVNNYSNNKYQHPSFQAYKHLGKVILTSEGIAAAYIAKAFQNSPEEDILEVSTVDGDIQASANAFEKLKQYIKEIKNDANAKPVNPERFSVDYKEPVKEPVEEEEEETNKFPGLPDWVKNEEDEAKYYTIRIYCNSDMM